MRGYYGVGVYHPKREVNVGTLWRTAHLLGAAFLYTVGRRYTVQASDTTRAWRHVPLFHYATVDALIDAQPADCLLVGVELDARATPLSAFTHPVRAIYLLGAENEGIPLDLLARCAAVVKLPGAYSMNLAVAGSIVLYDRVARANSDTGGTA